MPGKKLKVICLLFVAVFTLPGAMAQADSADWNFPFRERVRNDIGIVFGVHQFRKTFFELGISHTKSYSTGCAFGGYFYGNSLSAHYNPFQNRAGLAVTRWTSIGTVFILGLDINTYTDFTKYDFGIKPFVGIGPGKLSLTYGYNFLLVNNRLTDINRHFVSLRYHLGIWNLKSGNL